uniref:Replication protein A subunit n=1 Tax=Amorphochlora amoebiformis TaxID=1561963 RepID=A0A7S0DU28_9EUKA
MEIKDPHFIPISQLEESPPNTIVDVIGIVKFASDSVKITSRNGREVEKRTLSLVDDSNVEVNVAIWGERASASSPLTASWERCPVLALQGVRVSDYDGRTLSVITTTKIEVDPNIERADQLREWFAVQGSTATPRMISTAPADDRPVGNLDIRNIEELNSLIANLEAGETIAKYVEITTGVEFIKRESAWYPACPKNDCNTKVIPDGQGGYRCEKCDQTHSSKTNRYVLQATLQDDTGSTWVTAFGDQALLLMDGLSADALERFQNEDLDKFDHAFQATQGKKFKFTIRLKSEEYQEQKRVRPIVVKIEEIHEPDTAVSAAEGGV